MEQLNETVYLLYEPPGGATPNVEVVFIHGVYEGRNNKQAHIEAWSTFDNSVGANICWPEKWLPKEFSNARILSVSYDSPVRESKGGNPDRYCTAENLIQDLTSVTARVGQTENCPLILVGQDMGGLVIKAICLKAHAERDRSVRYEAFLEAVKYIFYYSTPHEGLDSMPSHFNTLLAKTLDIKHADTSGLNHEFNILRNKRKWKAKGMGGACSSSQGWFGKFTGYNPKNCPEGSTQCDVDEYYTVDADFESVSKPTSREDVRYCYLADVIKEVPKPEVEPATVWRSFLYFVDDQYFVPMETSFNQVKEAFKDSRVVLLHGGPGMGKSSLARYFALRFEEEEAKKQQSQTPGSGSAPASLHPAVAFVTCGRSADVVRVQEDLLRYMKVEYSEPHTKDPGRLHTIISEHLRERNGLVVLDDVWNRDVIQNVFAHNSKLRYLITTQLSNLWGSSESKKVQIQDIDLHSARRILIKYAEFKDGMMPEDLQNDADKIIKDLGYHPLALANLGTFLKVREERKCDPDYWKELHRNLEYCRSNEYTAAVFGEHYPSSVYASMMLMIDHGQLDTGARKLLCAICLFDGPLIAEPTVRSLFLFIESQIHSDVVLNSFGSKLTALMTRNLIQLEKEPIYKHRYKPVSQEMGGEEARGGYRTLLRIHGLRQKFILETLKDEVDELTRFLHQHNRIQYFSGGSERSNFDLATSLCTIFGEARIKKVAIARTGGFYRWNADCYREVNIVNAFNILLSLIWIEESEANDKSHIRTAATEVLWKLFIDGALDDDNISYLLAQPMSARWTCDFLCEFSSLLPSQCQYSMQERLVEEQVFATKVVIPLCLGRLSECLGQDVQSSTRDSAILALSHLALAADTLHETLTDDALLSNMLLIPGLYERIMDLTNDLEVSEFLRGVALVTIQSLAGNLETALGRLTDERVAGIFAVLAARPHGAEVVIKSPICLQRLIELISPERGIEADNQERALGALASIATRCTNDTVTKMVFHTDVLGRIVRLLSKELGNRCLLAIAITGALARACGDRISNVPQFPYIVQRIVQRLAILVDQDSNVEMQQRAIHAMADMLSCVVDHEDSFSATRRFVERTIMLVNEVSDVREEQLAKLIYILSRTREGFVGLHDCVEGFVVNLMCLMARDELSNIRSDAICTLANITACNDEQLNMAILACPHFFESITTCLTWTNDVQQKVCSKAIQIIRRLVGRGAKLSPAVPGIFACRDKLFELLASDLQANIQVEALGALESIIAAGGREQREALIELCSDEVYEAVLKCVSKDVDQRMCVEAMRIIPRLPWGEKSMPRCLDKFAPLLAQDVEGSVQKAALSALGALLEDRFGDESTDVCMALRMLECPGLFERVGTHLSNVQSGKISGKIIDWVVGVFNRSYLPGTEEVEIAAGCLQSDRFSKMLALDVDAMVRDVALSALLRLPNDIYRTIRQRDEITMLATKRLLERLGSLLLDDPITAFLIEDIVTWPANEGLILQCPNAIHNLQMLAGVLLDDEDDEVEEMMMKKWIREGIKEEKQNSEVEENHQYEKRMSWRRGMDNKRSEWRLEWMRRRERAWMTEPNEVAQYILARLYFDDKLRVCMYEHPRLQSQWQVLRPIIRLLLVFHVNDKCSSVSYSYARQVFLNYVEHGQFHEESTSNLLDSRHHALPMVKALRAFASRDLNDAADESEDTSDHNARTKLARTKQDSPVGPKVLSSLFGLLEYSIKMIHNTRREQEIGFSFCSEVSYAVGLLVRKDRDDSTVNLNEKGSLTRAITQVAEILTNANLSRDPRTQIQAVAIIGCLASSSEIFELELANVRGLPEGLITAFSRHDSPELQALALNAICKLAADVDSFRSKLVDVSDTLEGLVKTLTTEDTFELHSGAVSLLKDLSKNEHAALKIVSCPGALERLLSGVCIRGTSPWLRGSCAEAFANLATWGSSIPSELTTDPKYLKSLLTAFFEDGNQGFRFSEDDNQDFKAKILSTLSNLAANNESFRLELGVRVKTFFQTDNRADQIQALQDLTVFLKNDSLRLTLISMPGFLEGLIEALGGSHPLSMSAAKLLTRLVQGGHHIKSEMRNWPGFLEKIVDVATMGQVGNDFNPICALTHLNPQRGKEMQLRSAMAYTGRGQAEAELGLHLEALEDLDEACRLDPAIWYTLSVRCYVKAKLSDLQGALVDANRAFEINPTLFTLLERGILKRMIDDLPGALADFNKCLEWCPETGPDVPRYGASKHAILKHRGCVKLLLRDEDGAHVDAKSASACKPLTSDDMAISFLSETRPVPRSISRKYEKNVITRRRLAR